MDRLSGRIGLGLSRLAAQNSKREKVRALDWKCYNTYDKTTHWFEVIGEELRNPDLGPENVYNMDETGVILSMLTSINVLISKDDQRD
jgi:hypothetical protein